MSISTGYADLQTDTNDKSKTQRFKVYSNSKSKTTAKKSAMSLRKKGKKARIVKEGSYYVVYVRG